MLSRMSHWRSLSAALALLTLIPVFSTAAVTAPTVVKKPFITTYHVNLTLATAATPAAVYGTFQTLDGAPSGYLYVNWSGTNFGGNVQSIIKQTVTGGTRYTFNLRGLLTRAGKRSVGSGLVIMEPVAGKLPKVTATVNDATGKEIYAVADAVPSTNGGVSIQNL